jgi:predicted glycogen debranching enzyme
VNHDPDVFTSLVGAIEGGEPEWLVTNGLGGYASGTVSGRITRRFHGLLVAALPAPQGRTMMLNKLAETVRLEGRSFRLSTPSGNDPSPAARLPVAPLESFRLDRGLPVWTHQLNGARLERRIVMVHGQNTTFVVYRQLGGRSAMELELEPWINFRPHGGAVDAKPAGLHALLVRGSQFEIQDADPELPPLRLRVDGARPVLLVDTDRVKHVHYPIEHRRGYDGSGDLYSLGALRVPLEPDASIALVASTEPWETTALFTRSTAQWLEQARRARLVARVNRAVTTPFGETLTLAADQFVVKPVGRVADAALARASGGDVRTIIAGYPWFTDWGRDAMIGLEGLTLVTGRYRNAACVLRTFARHVRNGLVPNLFPERQSAGLYHTADASLWFVHAVDRYLAYTGDVGALEGLLPVLLDIADHHERGTSFGIGVDPDDGLLRQGAPGYQLTWMDAKVGDLVVTPRRGKAVEINALYYNALRLLEDWTRSRAPERSDVFRRAADRLQASFNARFWIEAEGYLLDVVDGERGDDPSFRPNQIFAISLPHPVLDPRRWSSVVAQVEARLLTPVGLRSLAPGDPEYKPKYFGDLRARDLAYHQGTVWAWLIGPFVDAWLRVHEGREREATRFLEGISAVVGERGCIGTIGEIFDGDAPFVGRGCVAQAWSVAEVLRCHARLAGATPPW